MATLIKGTGAVHKRLEDSRCFNPKSSQKTVFMSALLPAAPASCQSLLVILSADAFSRDFQFISNQALSNILPTGN